MDNTKRGHDFMQNSSFSKTITADNQPSQVPAPPICKDITSQQLYDNTPTTQEQLAFMLWSTHSTTSP